MGLFRKKKPAAASDTATSSADPTPTDATRPDALFADSAAPGVDPPAESTTQVADPQPASDAAAANGAALDELRTELAAMRTRLDDADRAKAELESTVDELSQRLIASAPPPPPPPAPVPPPPSPAAAADESTAVTDELERRLAELDSRMALLDDRVTSVSTELANQVTEIGNDIEPIQAGAERLAAEQARYQIQFRQDLAELAERLRRPR